MSWAVTAAMAGLSIAQGISANQQASANARATAAQLLQSFNVNTNNIQNQANELNNQIGMELSKANFNEIASLGTITASAANKGYVGATSTRLQQNVGMQKALMVDAILQQGESKMKEVQTSLSTAHLQYQQGLFQNEMNRLNNTKSTGELIVNAGMAGLQGYSMVTSFQNTKLQTDILTQQKELYTTELNKAKGLEASINQTIGK